MLGLPQLPGLDDLEDDTLGKPVGSDCPRI